MNIGVKLQRLNTEDLIWIVYLFIAIAALISDHYERNYLKTNNPNSQKKFKLINITVLTIALFIYMYFILLNYDDIKHLKKEATKKEVITSHVALIAALLFFIGGILTWIAEINRNTPDNDFGII